NSVTGPQRHELRPTPPSKGRLLRNAPGSVSGEPCTSSGTPGKRSADLPLLSGGTLVAPTGSAGGAMAAVDYFIKFDGIKGESADAQQQDEIHVESWSVGETNTAGGSGGGGGGAGKVAMQDFHFTMQLNRASP